MRAASTASSPVAPADAASGSSSPQSLQRVALLRHGSPHRNRGRRSRRRPAAVYRNGSCARASGCQRSTSSDARIDAARGRVAGVARPPRRRSTPGEEVVGEPAGEDRHEHVGRGIRPGRPGLDGGEVVVAAPIDGGCVRSPSRCGRRGRGCRARRSRGRRHPVPDLDDGVGDRISGAVEHGSVQTDGGRMPRSRHLLRRRRTAGRSRRTDRRSATASAGISRLLG